MKKILYIFIFIVTLLLGLYFFVSSNYFFNKYIAKNIKEYGFSYTYVDGAILQGFEIEELSYKGDTLASNVIIKINPLKLLFNKISISKLHLVGVRKKSLDRVIKDFKPKEDSNKASVDINFNFEIKDILLTIRPFEIEDIKFKKLLISVDYIKYIDNKFDVGKVNYNSNTNIGNFNFRGKYIKKVLNIDDLKIENFNIEKITYKINKLKNDDNASKDSELLSSPFMPKKFIISNSDISLQSFKLKNLNIKDIILSSKDIVFDVDTLTLIKGKVKAKINSNEFDLNTNFEYKDKTFYIENFDLGLIDLNNLEKFISLINSETNSSNNTANKNKIIPFQRVILSSGKIKIENYIFKGEKIIKSLLLVKNIDFNNSKLKVDNFSLKLNSQNAKLNLVGKIDKNIEIDLIDFSSDNVDSLLNIIRNKSSKNNSAIKLGFIPNSYSVKDININGKKLSFGAFVIDNFSSNFKNLTGSINKLNINSKKAKVNIKSNWGDTNLTGNIKNNNYYAQGKLKVSQLLFDKYNIALIAKNIDTLNVKGEVGLNSLVVNTDFKGKNILKNMKDFTILNSDNLIKYTYKTNNLILKTDAKINTPYTKIAILKNTLTYNKKDKINFNGSIKPLENIFNNKSYSKLFDNLKVNFNGNSNSLKLDFISNLLKGELVTSNYKNGILKVKNYKSISIEEFINISNSKIDNIDITSNINFNKLLPIKGDISLKSNIFNSKGMWEYDKNNLNSKLKIEIPRESIVIKNNKKINYNAIKSFDSEIKISKNIDIKVKNDYINSSIKYNIDSKVIDSTIDLAKERVKLSGELNNLKASLSINSLKDFINSLHKIYKIEQMDINGKLDANIEIKNLKNVNFLLKSPKIIYGQKNPIEIDNINLKGSYSNNILNINNYNLTYDNYKLYSTKNCISKIKNSIVDINFWLNNSLNINGVYNFKNSSGKFKLNADNFKIESKEANLNVAVKTNLDINGDKKYLRGLLTILNGKIKSSIKRRAIADNKDIIILQRKQAKENTSFAKNIKLNLLVKSKKPIIYSDNVSYFKLITNLKIDKEYKNLSKFIGDIEIAKGSYYKLKEKKLVITKGKILFKGKSVAPNLNIELAYKGKEYTIYINISGTPSQPILFFRSNPPLTKEQILAYLLFDDSSAVGTHSQESMLNMIGSSLAKSFLGSIGIKIDHISVKENGFSIGKSIGKNITVYYNQDNEKPSVKTRIDISSSIHTEIELGKDKQSANIIFSKEY